MNSAINASNQGNFSDPEAVGNDAAAPPFYCTAALDEMRPND
jgi:hypothetical protein